MSARSWLVLLFAVGCGSRSSPSIPSPPVDGGAPGEVCNGRDDNRDGLVDEPFRTDAGTYLDPQHCGACNSPCAVDETRELAVGCEWVDGAARCVASSCLPGYGPTRDGHCAALAERFCLSCADARDCGSLLSARCAEVAGESRCTTTCEAGCPSGAQCDPALGVCVPQGGSCSCGPTDSFAAACRPSASELDGGGVCVGVARCEAGEFSACATSSELCDEQDNDCDGEVDEDFRDANGAYGVSLSHCGRCGVACEDSPVPGYAITCAGDPFAPSCVLACPDAVDGVDEGDQLDANRAFGDGCECRVSGLIDNPGPHGLAGAALDSNCDGADGDVLSSFYVAVDGDDSGPGSPTRPLATLGEALARAAELPVPGQRARRSVFVAGGTYVGSITLPDGVSVYGGYRRDFLDLDAAAYPTELLASTAPRAELGAALFSDGAGASATELAFVTLRGADATGPGEPSVAALLRGTGPGLTLRGVTLVAGVPGQGSAGGDGAAGLGPSREAGAGGEPRVALEDGRGTCTNSAANVVAGGAGGVARCGGGVLQGGSGGAPGCPTGFGSSGGGGAGSGGAAGGRGGDEAVGPIEASPSSASCPGPRDCCGLADFSVSTNYTGPSAGDNGGPGQPGTSGAGCGDALGSFARGLFVAGAGSAGQSGTAGGAGGGGGGGGGVQMSLVPGDPSCQWPDGLGGGGGGGGAGGCGGAAGLGGSSGAPSVALLLYTPVGAPQLLGVTFRTADGGRGGAGGSGGDGGQGGAGGPGGSLPLAQRIIPPLAGASPGAPGGSGGAGGAGGSGGGGCGGASAGLWAVGLPGAAALAAGNRFELGRGGPGGEGGPGAVPGQAGRVGEVRDVVVE